MLSNNVENTLFQSKDVGYISKLVVVRNCILW